MRIRISSANGRSAKIESFVKQGVPSVDIEFGGIPNGGFDVVGILEVSEFDPVCEIKRIIPVIGRNIASASGEARVRCTVDRYPEITWVNDLDGW
ncbi:MAG: hypothetical protein RLZZ416_506 [Candidatus Parcubacteria bacterium]